MFVLLNLRIKGILTRRQRKYRPWRPDLSNPKMIISSISGSPEGRQKEAAMPIAGIYGPEDFGGPAHRPSNLPVSHHTGPASHADALPTPSLEWTGEVERATAHLYE